MPQWDVFISHASEDKADVAQPLASELVNRGLTVWFDAFALTIGDRLRRSIDQGLAASRFGIVVVSPHFLDKEWPQRELDGILALETDGRKMLLPIWHRLTYGEVAKRYPMLADRVAGTTSAGIEALADQIMRAVRGNRRSGSSPEDHDAEVRLQIADGICAMESDERMGNRWYTYAVLYKIADEARVLADVWNDLVDAYTRGLTSEQCNEALGARMRRLAFSQVGIFAGLREFHRFASESRVSGEVITAIDSIVREREDARSVVDAVLRHSADGVSAGAGTPADLCRLHDAVTHLNEQAGRLRAMEKLFKLTL